MSAGKYDIRVDQGSDFSLQLTVQESGSAKNLTGFSVRGQVRSTKDSSTVTASFTTAVTNAAAGICTISLPFATTTNMAVGQYFYDIEVFTGSTVQRLIEGLVTVSPEVTR
jgi:hypothetical protein